MVFNFKKVLFCIEFGNRIQQNPIQIKCFTVFSSVMRGWQNQWDQGGLIYMREIQSSVLSNSCNTRGCDDVSSMGTSQPIILQWLKTQQQELSGLRGLGKVPLSSDGTDPVLTHVEIKTENKI